MDIKLLSALALLKSADPWSDEGAAMLRRKNGLTTVLSNFEIVDSLFYVSYSVTLILEGQEKLFPGSDKTLG